MYMHTCTLYGARSSWRSHSGATLYSSHPAACSNLLAHHSDRPAPAPGNFSRHPIIPYQPHAPASAAAHIRGYTHTRLHAATRTARRRGERSGLNQSESGCLSRPPRHRRTCSAVTGNASPTSSYVYAQRNAYLRCAD
jgi:hypothetical protein